MKKIFLLSMFCIITLTNYAQDNNKSVKLGIQAISAVQWFKIDAGKQLKSDGAKPKGGFGLNVDFRITDVIWFNTGANLFYDGGKIAYTDTVKYFLDKTSDQFVKLSEAAKMIVMADSSKLEVYKLNARTYKSTNLQIPLFIRLRTKEFGKFRYFGQFGVNANFRLKAKATDQVQRQKFAAPSSFDASVVTKENLDITNDANLINLGLAVGAGAEYNLSGSTNVFASLNFVNLGFTNFAKPTSSQLFTTDGNNNKSYKFPALAQKFLSRGVTLTVGISF